MLTACLWDPARMKLLLKAMAVAAVTVIALGCSIMDPDDRDELR